MSCARRWSPRVWAGDRKSTRLNSSHLVISYAVFCLKKKKKRSCKRTSLFNSVSYDKAKQSKEQKRPLTADTFGRMLALASTPGVLHTFIQPAPLHK